MSCHGQVHRVDKYGIYSQVHRVDVLPGADREKETAYRFVYSGAHADSHSDETLTGTPPRHLACDASVCHMAWGNDAGICF